MPRLKEPRFVLLEVSRHSVLEDLKLPCFFEQVLQLVGLDLLICDDVLSFGSQIYLAQLLEESVGFFKLSLVRIEILNFAFWVVLDAQVLILLQVADQDFGLSKLGNEGELLSLRFLVSLSNLRQSHVQTADSHLLSVKLLSELEVLLEQIAGLDVRVCYELEIFLVGQGLSLNRLQVGQIDLVDELRRVVEDFLDFEIGKHNIRQVYRQVVENRRFYNFVI